MGELEHMARMFVPLAIDRIRQSGGPDWSRISEIAQHLPLTEGLMIGNGKDDCGLLIESLALLSFLPGGVSFGELHFESA